jgi:hypothetical protein
LFNPLKKAIISIMRNFTDNPREKAPISLNGDIYRNELTKNNTPFSLAVWQKWALWFAGWTFLGLLQAVRLYQIYNYSDRKLRLGPGYRLVSFRVVSLGTVKSHSCPDRQKSNL